MTTAAAANYVTREHVSSIADEDWISLNHVARINGGGFSDDWDQACEKAGVEFRPIAQKYSMVRRRDIEKLIGPQKARTLLLRGNNFGQWLDTGIAGMTLGVGHHLAGHLARLRGCAIKEGTGVGAEILASDVVALKRVLDRERLLPSGDGDWIDGSQLSDMVRHATRVFIIPMAIDEDTPGANGLDYEIGADGTPRAAPWKEMLHRLHLLQVRWKHGSQKGWQPRRILLHSFDLFRLVGIVDPAKEADFQERLAYAAGEEPIS